MPFRCWRAASRWPAPRARPDPWNLPALEQEHPALAGVPGHRLKDVRPYVLPAAGELTFFLCRWPDDAAIPVAIDTDAAPEQRRAIAAALDAWQGAGARRALRAARTPDRAARHRHPLDREPAGRASDTIANCRVDSLEDGPASGPLPAELEFASIHLAAEDPLLTGRALHELGHALGFQGHPTRGDTVMLRGMTASRLAGDRARSGDLKGDAALSALYALPSGTVLSRRALPLERTRPVDRLVPRAGGQGWAGPFVRVGDERGVLFWRDSRGDSIAFTLTGLSPARSDPLRIQLTPNARAQRELERLETR